MARHVSASVLEDELVASLRAILAATGTSGKALEAKASAARQLSAVLGLGGSGKAAAAGEEELPPDPIAAAGLDDLAPIRRRRQ
jgi:hypothetical protein